MTRRVGWVLVAGVVAAVPQFAGAVNLYFMPGDAFFSAGLSEERAAGLPDAGGTVVLRQRVMWDAMYGCGFAGFRELEVRNVPPEVAAGLKTLYRELRRQDYWKEERVVIGKDGTVTREETNPLVLMIYDKSFDPGRYHFGLKYNETWADFPREALLDGRGAEAKYEKAVPGEEALMRDWRDSRKVAALPIEVPAGVKWASPSDGQHPPAIAKARDLRFFVLPDDRFEQYYKKEAYSLFWEVSSQGFRRFRYVPTKGDWEQTHLVATEIPFDQPQRLTESDREPDDDPEGGGTAE